MRLGSHLPANISVDKTQSASQVMLQISLDKTQSASQVKLKIKSV